MDWIYLIGRVLLSAIFVSSGISHFARRSAMVEYARFKGAPMPGLSVAATGIMILLGGLSVLLGAYMEIGTWLLVAFLLPAAFLFHDFWAHADAMEKANQQAHFMKNLALTGAALILYWLVQEHGYGPLTLGDPMS